MIFGDVDVAVPVFNFGPNHTINSCVFSTIAVQRKQSLDPNIGAGPDGIPPAVLKNVPKFLLYTSLFT